MSKFSINYQELSNTVNYADKKVFKFADVKDKIEKVAFDLVRFKDGNPEELWQMQDSDDGTYIVARYDSEEESKEVKTSSNKWDALINTASGDINIFYKGQQLTKLAASKLGVASEDLPSIKRFLPNKLASDKSFVSALLDTLDETSRKSVIKLYPELL